MKTGVGKKGERAKGAGPKDGMDNVEIAQPLCAFFCALLLVASPPSPNFYPSISPSPTPTTPFVQQSIR
jgi:hypothetical protein